MEQPVTYSKHKKFNFKEAKTVAKYYANCEESPTVTQVSYWLQYDRKQVIRFLKVAIIFQLVSREEVEKIINCKSRSYNKYAGTKTKEISTYERCLEFADERVMLVNKMEKMLMMFPSQNQERIKEKYLPRILEIERYAFH